MVSEVEGSPTAVPTRVIGETMLAPAPAAPAVGDPGSASVLDIVDDEFDTQNADVLGFDAESWSQ